MRRLKGHRPVAIGLTLLLALIACSKEPTVVKVPVASDTPIVFANPMPETKGAPQLLSLERLAAQHFGVSAWYTPEAETFGDASILYLQNKQFGTLDKDGYTLWQGTSGSGDSEIAAPVYYPLDGTLSFFCYAPYRDDVSSSSDIYINYFPEDAITSQLPNYLPDSPLICFTPKQLAASQIDFLVATPILDVSRNAVSTPVDFTEHLTTSIQFYAMYQGNLDASESVVISQINIRNVIGSEYIYFTETEGVLGRRWCNTVSPVDGSSTMPLTSYTLSINTGELIETTTLSNSAYTYINESIKGSMYLLPQVLTADSYLDITYKVKDYRGVAVDENTVSVSLNGTADWPVGKAVRYYIQIRVADRKDISITASVEPWISAGNPHSDNELLY